MSVVALVPVEGLRGRKSGAASLNLVLDELMASGAVDCALVVIGSLRRAVDDQLAGRPDTRVVLLHDGSNVSAEVVRRVVADVLKTGRPVVPVLPCSDTVKRVDDDAVVLATPDRALLRVTRPPFGFPADLFRARPDVDPDDPALLAGALVLDLSTVAGAST
jgi:2-C-methyl-D-erythritol 4-phosphate cytidylyltransferase